MHKVKNTRSIEDATRIDAYKMNKATTVSA